MKERRGILLNTTSFHPSPADQSGSKKQISESRAGDCFQQLVMNRGVNSDSSMIKQWATIRKCQRWICLLSKYRYCIVQYIKFIHIVPILLNSRKTFHSGTTSNNNYYILMVNVLTFNFLMWSIQKSLSIMNS